MKQAIAAFWQFQGTFYFLLIFLFSSRLRRLDEYYEADTLLRIVFFICALTLGLALLGSFYCGRQSKSFLNTFFGTLINRAYAIFAAFIAVTPAACQLT